jgi:hypothetical protein
MTGATAIESSLWRKNATSVREVGKKAALLTGTGGGVIEVSAVVGRIRRRRTTTSIVLALNLNWTPDLRRKNKGVFFSTNWGPPLTTPMGMVYRVHNYSSYYRTFT